MCSKVNTNALKVKSSVNTTNMTYIQCYPFSSQPILVHYIKILLGMA